MSYREARDAPTQPIDTSRAPGSRIQMSQTEGRTDTQPPPPNRSNRHKITSLLCFRSPSLPPQQSGPLSRNFSSTHIHARACTHARTHTSRAEQSSSVSFKEIGGQLEQRRAAPRRAAAPNHSYVTTTASDCSAAQTHSNRNKPQVTASPACMWMYACLRARAAGQWRARTLLAGVKCRKGPSSEHW